MTDVLDLGTAELLDGFRARQLSPVDAVEACAARIAAVDGELSAFRSLCLDRAVAEARAAERAYESGTARPLAGVPFAAKDIFDTAGVATGYGSPMFADHIPKADAAAVARLRSAGAVLVGKTATHEFAWGITSVNPRVATPRNPVDPQRVAGGSSGGSAVALAARQIPFALGTDTGGSVRIPSSFCGIAGHKPTFGTISRTGVWPLAASLDHVGAMAPAAADLPPWLHALGVLAPDAGRPPGAPRIGVCPDLHRVALAPGVQEVFETAIEAARMISSEVTEVRFAGAERVVPTFATIQRAEALVTHRRAGLFPARAAEYGDDVRDRLQAAMEITLDDYADATAARLELDVICSAMFADVDLVITPITAVAPPLIADPDEVDHLGRRMTLRDCVLPYTVPQDLLGLPACAVRAGHDASGLPVGVQVWGPRGRDAVVLAAAAAIEAALHFDGIPSRQGGGRI